MITDDGEVKGEALTLANLNMRLLGAELKRTREQRGLKQEEAAQALGVARTTLVAIEKGDRRIKAEELIKLAETYGRQVSDFVRGRPEVEFSQPQFRSLSSLNPDDKKAVEASIEELQELSRDYVELEELTERPIPKNYPPEYSVSGKNLERTAEIIASQERNRLGIGDNPLSNLRGLLEHEVGLRIFFLKLPKKFSGIYLFSDKVGGCIAVNRDHPIERQRFTLLHDYFHFLTERYKEEITPTNGFIGRSREEDLADAGAIYFLMPTHHVTKYFLQIKEDKGEFTVADLVNMANYYGVSLEALTRRLEELKLVNTGTLERVKKGGVKVTELREKLGLSQVYEYQEKLPERYKLLALQAHKAGLISNSQLARFLRVDLLEARSQAELYSDSEDDKEDFASSSIVKTVG